MTPANTLLKTEHAVMDLATIKTEEKHWDDSVECKLFSNGQPEVNSKGDPIVFHVVSDRSKAARRIQQKHKHQIAKLLRVYGSWDAIPQDDIDALGDAKTAACISGWTGLEMNGEAFPYSAENAVAVMTALRENKPQHFKRIEATIESHDSFFGAASAS